jgi:hypothetical protein
MADKIQVEFIDKVSDQVRKSIKRLTREMESFSIDDQTITPAAITCQSYAEFLLLKRFRETARKRTQGAVDSFIGYKEAQINDSPAYQTK